MKGVVFTVFLEMVEEQFSPEIADKILDSLPEEFSGAYTSVGNYSHEEMIALIVALGKETKIDVPDLVQAYGRHLFGEFHKMHPAFFAVDNAYSFLESVDQHIHKEVKKLYSDADLPRFETVLIFDGDKPVGIDMEYISARPFAQLAYGLIEGSLSFWGHEATIQMKDKSTAEMTRADFCVRDLVLAS